MTGQRLSSHAQPKLPHHTNVMPLTHYVLFNVQKADPHSNWVSSREPSGPEAETLPLGYSGPMGFIKEGRKKFYHSAKQLVFLNRRVEELLKIRNII
ncbi:hypothetical protein AVEN_177479-1 [Araneus ventricosus]|uniref:Uncharacterized protein n=1 Tax=Araneus ventricosus TaxID=182803 RepID=A0A4Y2D1J6_ARAVE|nr:hypothetical protein AVEN_177479-1 [Araneus ventricosus]